MFALTEDEKDATSERKTLDYHIGVDKGAQAQLRKIWATLHLKGNPMTLEFEDKGEVVNEGFVIPWEVWQQLRKEADK